MKTFVLFLILMWLPIACADNYNNGYSDAKIECKHIVDSLTAKCDTLIIERDSLQFKYDEQVDFIWLCKLQGEKYSKIVQKNPTQVQFLVGWISRTFEGAVQPKKQKQGK